MPIQTNENAHKSLSPYLTVSMYSYVFSFQQITVHSARIKGPHYLIQNVILIDKMYIA